MKYRDDLIESQIKQIGKELRKKGIVNSNSCFEISAYNSEYNQSFTETYCEHDAAVSDNEVEIDHFGMSLENAISVCIEGSSDITSVGGKGPEDLLKTIN
ncbi:hypothetical protein [Vibrio sp. 10N.239.312.D08]|uniref:hypothetical protein n=1 Tax=Vibrio sp. 10N.239.312.D08 TaxID=3229978 RepID=UPI00354CD179